MDIKATRRLLFTLSTSHYYGFKKVITQDINYSVNNQPEHTAQKYSSGDMQTFSLGLKYAIKGRKKK